MPRAARLVVPGLPHHVTQRGNRRQPTFFGDSDLLGRLSTSPTASLTTLRTGGPSWSPRPRDEASCHES
jgi:hypothetical protein